MKQQTIKQSLFIILFSILLTACGGGVALPDTTTSNPTNTPKTLSTLSFSANKININPIEFIPKLPLSTKQQLNSYNSVYFKGWSNSGKKLAFSFVLIGSDTFPNPDPPIGQEVYHNQNLWVSNVDGSNPQKVGEWSSGLVLWSPDDKQILYEKRINSTKTVWVVVDLNTMTHIELNSPPKEVMGETHFYGNITWLDEEQILYPTYGKNKSRILWQHSIQTNHLKAVIVDEAIGDFWHDIEVAPNKKDVMGQSDNIFWLGKLVVQDNVLVLNYEKTVLTDKFVTFQWSPDSTKLAVYRSHDLITHIYNPYSIHVIDLDMDTTTEIPIPVWISEVAWSPDNKMLIVPTRSAGVPNNWTFAVNVDGSELQKLTDIFWPNLIHWSPDGQYVAFNEIDESFKLFEVNLK